jgi:small-conductance mechanosensitive channel
MKLYEHIIYSMLTLICGYSLLYGIVSCLREKTRFSHGIQLFITFCAIGIFGLFVFLGFGQDTFSHLLMGIFIGFGLALQPLVKVIINGFIFDGTQIPRSSRVIEIPSKNVKGTINTVGMLHTWIEDSDGHLTMVSNNILGEEPIKVYKRPNRF